MYNQIIRDRIENLTYLSNLKNSNASAITKKNPYGDIVKFYAQINKNNVIEAITFKATGCTYFVALSSYFCELAEGKTIDEALKISENDLVAFAKLDESKHHIYPLILGTFALLVKKYRKALADGKVKPCEVSKTIKKESKSVVKASSKKSTVTTNSDIILSQKAISKKSAVTEENIIASRVSSITREIRKTENELISLDSKRNEIQLSREEKKQLKLEEKARQKEEKKLAKEQKLADKKAKSSNSLSKKATSTATIVAEKKMEKNVSNKTNNSSKAKSVTSKSAKSANVSASAKKSATKVSTENVSTTTKSTTTQTIEVASATSKRATGSKSALAKSTSSATKSASSKTTGAKGSTKKIVSAKDDIVVIEDNKKVASSKARNQKETISSAIQTSKKSLDLAKINEDESIVISDEVPSENNTQIIVETVEQKRRVETVVANGNTTTIEAGRVDAMKVSAEGDEAYKQIHSATSMGDMLHRLQTSQARVKDIEGHTAVNAKKTVNGKVVDSVSKSDSFSSMRDSLQKMRLEKESKALPLIENKEDSEEKPKKRGLFSKLFKK